MARFLLGWGGWYNEVRWWLVVISVLWGWDDLLLDRVLGSLLADWRVYVGCWGWLLEAVCVLSW